MLVAAKMGSFRHAVTLYRKNKQKRVAETRTNRFYLAQIQFT